MARVFCDLIWLALNFGKYLMAQLDPIFPLQMSY